MLRPVYFCNKNPKIHAAKIALKKEGILIPKVLTHCTKRSNHELALMADNTPKNNPIIRAIIRAATAKTAVLGKVSAII